MNFRRFKKKEKKKERKKEKEKREKRVLLFSLPNDPWFIRLGGWVVILVGW